MGGANANGFSLKNRGNSPLLWWTLQLSPRGMNPFLPCTCCDVKSQPVLWSDDVGSEDPFSGPRVAKVTPSFAAGLHVAPLCRSMALISKLRGVLTTDAAQLSIDHP